MSPEEQVLLQARQMMQAPYTQPIDPSKSQDKLLMDFMANALGKVSNLPFGGGGKSPVNPVGQIPAGMSKTAPEIFNAVRNTGLEAPANINIEPSTFGKRGAPQGDPYNDPLGVHTDKSVKDLNMAAEGRHQADLYAMALQKQAANKNKPNYMMNKSLEDILKELNLPLNPEGK